MSAEFWLAPILYSSAQQVNVQAPYEIAGQATVQMQMIDKQIPLALSETHAVAVADRQPAIFLSPAATVSAFPGYTVCGGVVAIGAGAVAMNEDGTLNDCTNLAASGSVVTIIVNGLGAVTPPQATGAISPAPAVALSPSVALLDAGDDAERAGIYHGRGGGAFHGAAGAQSVDSVSADTQSRGHDSGMDATSLTCTHS